MTAFQWKKEAQTKLLEAGVPDAEVDAKLLLADALRTEPACLITAYYKELSEDTRDRLDTALERRLAREPLQYICAKAYFMGLELYVDRRVLIPRQDTETLCEAALERMTGMKAPEVLDMCTGSGALALAIKHLRPDAQVTASDISTDALDVTKTNMERLQLRIETVKSDAYSNLSGRSFDIIVCNPPYLTCEDMDELQPEVTNEPALALEAGTDGLDFYKKHCTETLDFLRPKGYALFEVGKGQAESVLKLFCGLQGGIIKDLCGIDRVVWIRK